MENKQSVYKLSFNDAETGMAAICKQMLYFFAAVKVRGGGIVYVKNACKETEALQKKRTEGITSELKKLKRQGDIFLFVPGEEIGADHVAIRYLIEKNPDLFPEEPKPLSKNEFLVYIM